MKNNLRYRKVFNYRVYMTNFQNQLRLCRLSVKQGGVSDKDLRELAGSMGICTTRKTRHTICDEIDYLLSNQLGGNREPGTTKENVEAVEVAQINSVLKEINQLSEELNTGEPWEESIELKPFLLTMDDVVEMKKGAKKYVIEPQTYDNLALFTRMNDLQYFDGTYSNGEARTGSGSDPWLLYKKNLLQALLKVRDNLSEELREHGRYEMDPQVRTIFDGARSRITKATTRRRERSRPKRKIKV